jgi:predicted ribosome quality control (RQC) complex YloA/Tae2 family protein
VQIVDFTTLTAACSELRTQWLPSRLEQVYQRDRFTLSLGLRTLDQRGWLTLSWHPQAARVCIDSAPPRTPDTFTFSQQLRHQLSGLALVSMEAIAPWERALDLQFARRPGEPALWHLYVEIMGKYSNVILTTAENLIVTAAHQVSQQQSRVRPIQTGQPYQPPPQLLESVPRADESQTQWQQRVSLIPGPLQRNLLKSYRGLSSALVNTLVVEAGLSPQQPTENLTPAEWQQLFEIWQTWLNRMDTQTFAPGWLAQGYTVLGWGAIASVESVQVLLMTYYAQQLNQQDFQQLRQQLLQKLGNLLAKLRQKAQGFRERMAQAEQADRLRQQADLLMANLQAWQPGMKAIALPDFETEEPVQIPLDPEKNAIQNAQALYKRHQKLKRTRANVEPLLTDVQAEIDYLEQVEGDVQQCSNYQDTADLSTLQEIRDELIQQQYLAEPEYKRPAIAKPEFRRYQTPSGAELLIGRNNNQNDQLTFRVAGDYDLWFHAQEIPGSHVLLRLQPGSVPQSEDLGLAAHLAAYYSRAQQSAQVPVVYTEPKHVYKPKGAKPGVAIYKHEQVIWGNPAAAERWLQTASKLEPQKILSK